ELQTLQWSVADRVTHLQTSSKNRCNLAASKIIRLTNNELPRPTHPPRVPRFRPNCYPFTRASQISLIVAKDTAIALTRCRSGRDLRSIFLCQFVKPARHGAIEEILDGLAEIAARKIVDQLIKGVTMVEMLTPQDVSRITGSSLDTLAQWRSKKIHLPHLKIGRLIRYARRDVEAYLETCKVTVSYSHRRQK